MDEAEQRALQAEWDRQRSLEEAALAHSEPQRLLAEERARLLGVMVGIARQQARLATSVERSAAQAERMLGLRRQVRQLSEGVPPVQQVVDALYDELVASLSDVRAQLAQRLAEWPPASVGTNTAAHDLVDELGDTPEHARWLRLRTEVEVAASELDAERRRIGEQQIRQLHNALLDLNEDRLQLLGSLSQQRREALTGFGSAAFDQALAELRQVALVLRYHVHRGALWAAGGETGSMMFDRVSAAIKLIFKATVALLAFWWMRRLAREYLEAENERLNAQRGRRDYASNAHAAVRVGLDTLSPASWLLLVLIAWWLTPPDVRALMESRLVTAMLFWATGVWLGIALFDALAEQRSRLARDRGMRDNDVLRTRSLRLVGAVTVAAGVILTAANRIVGTGTIYSWVVTVCWLLALPLGLLLAGWWREAVFARLAGQRRKNRFETWVVGHRSGWRGRVGTVLAAAYLFSRGTKWLLADWIGKFDLTRRFLAWIFRRNLDRIGGQREKWSHAALPPEVFDNFSQAVASADLLALADPDAEDEVSLKERLAASGGITALVGERGSGRTTLLRGLARNDRRVLLVDCPFEGLDALAQELAQAAGMESGTALAELLAGLDVSDNPSMIVIDNAQRFAKPVMGGLSQLDELLDVARNRVHIAWVLSFDRVVWRFVSRARAVELLFDTVLTLPAWTEVQIRKLLDSRSRQAGIQPTYELLLPADAAALDTIEREDRLRDAARSYCRMIWDYSDGNPGVALQAWRDSLALAQDGRVVVTPFEAPTLVLFERLPDEAIFVLRAVLQLERALLVDIVAATQVAPLEVAKVLSHGLTRGVLRREGARYAVAWVWFRPLTRFLQRRHLISND